MTTESITPPWDRASAGGDSRSGARSSALRRQRARDQPLWRGPGFGELHARGGPSGRARRGPCCPTGAAVGRSAGVELVAAFARERNSDAVEGRLLLLSSCGSQPEAAAGYCFKPSVCNGAASTDARIWRTAGRAVGSGPGPAFVLTRVWWRGPVQWRCSYSPRGVVERPPRWSVCRPGDGEGAGAGGVLTVQTGGTPGRTWHRAGRSQSRRASREDAQETACAIWNEPPFHVPLSRSVCRRDSVRPTGSKSGRVPGGGR